MVILSKIIILLGLLFILSGCVEDNVLQSGWYEKCNLNENQCKTGFEFENCKIEISYDSNKNYDLEYDNFMKLCTDLKDMVKDNSDYNE